MEPDKRKIIISRDVKFKTHETKSERTVKIRLDEIEETPEQEDRMGDQIQDAVSEEEQEEEEEEAPPETPSKRKSERNRKQPDRYRDYVMLTYTEATTGPDRDSWIRAIKEEKCSLEENETWEVVDPKRAESQKPLKSKWVFKVKTDGTYKARLVVKGCEQKYGVNYEETYSPVISMSALRSLLAIAAAKCYSIVTFDIKTAFLYGVLEEEVYIYPPDGYKMKNKLCKLKKALYGLKQAPLSWNTRFSDFLKQNNFKPLESEQCLFKRENSDSILGIYVDDGILIGSDPSELARIVKELSAEFKMTATKNPKIFVGLEITKEDGRIKLTQKKYIEKILEDYDMKNAKPATVPMLKGEESKTPPRNNMFPYREIIGSLLYVSSRTRPDISYAVNYSSRYTENHSQENINDIKHIMKYLNGNMNQGLLYCSDRPDDAIEAYCDADFAGDTETTQYNRIYYLLRGWSNNLELKKTVHNSIVQHRS